MLGSCLVATANGCGGEADLTQREELQGFPAADVRDVLADESTEYDSTQDQVRAVQQFLKGWSACRDVYEVYDELLRTGELAPSPTARHAAREVPGTHEEITTFIAQMYDPMVAGKPEETRELLVDDVNCGAIPALDSRDRSVTIADAIEGS